MAAHKVYPIKGRYLLDHPAAVHVVDSKAEADALIATGAYTDNPRDPERDHEAPDLTKPPPTEAPAANEGPAETGGSSDSEES